MRTLAIGTLLGAGLMLTACKDKAKTEGGAAATAEEAKKSDSHVLASKGSKLPAKGKALTKENSGEMKDGKMSINAAGQKMEGTMSRSETTTETWTSLGDNKARRTLESKTTTGKMNLNGQDQPMPEEKDALIGVPVIVELKDGKYLATLESGEAAKGDQVKALEKVTDT
uniref:hypothetical protein n=1 Tax=Haloferula sp. BvORR071 TaxID=1396141 RepID=UPI002240F873